MWEKDVCVLVMFAIVVCVSEFFCVKNVSHVWIIDLP